MTAEGLPDLQRSAAVLIGVSEYAHLGALPATRNGCLRLWHLLTDPSVLGLPADNCDILTNLMQPYELLRAVSTAARHAEDTLLVYYAGHGVVDPEQGTLRLSVGLTEPHHRYSSGEAQQCDVLGAATGGGTEDPAARSVAGDAARLRTNGTSPIRPQDDLRGFGLTLS